MKHINGNTSYVVGVQRPEFWTAQPWEKLNVEMPHQFFPENDLLKSLIKIYFEQINPISGILHFPSFHQSMLEGLHFRDPEFGAVVLIVCSMASRHSDDPRVFLDGTNSEHSCGWNGSGSRAVQSVFWVLVVSDTIMSAFKGRPSITQPADFDLDLPVGLDDEYWGIPNAIQPHGRISNFAFTPVYMQLMSIFARIQRAVYPVNGQLCPQDVILELDSALNNWVDIIPEHLRWDPNQPNHIFLDQSATLYSTYYHAQILIHRPFIPAPGKQPMSNTHFPYLAICANAARSCGHVLDVQARRGRGLLHYPSLMARKLANPYSVSLQGGDRPHYSTALSSFSSTFGPFVSNP
ncbi:hypothetical protein C8R47DRAFT_1225056 [Mycena vitilis]|nr:hypothetical protein C8R47DRAFT_1225056 [Mycena vitilis]